MKRLLVSLLLFISLHSFGQVSWKSLKDIPKTWVMLERDSLGYLVYKPCNGETPRITIDTTYVTVFWRLDGPSKFHITKFTQLTKDKAFSISTTDEGNIDFNVIIKDEKKMLVLWSFAGFKWVMAPLKFKNKFRQVDNPCPTEMKPEKQFLPVEFR